jgi:Calcineurin-like phosphoesterase
MSSLVLRIAIMGLIISVSSAALAESASRYPAVERIVAIGDLHGDIAATRNVMRIAGVIDGNDAWVGGETVLVQCGDQLDRGSSEQAILELLVRLKREAKSAGGDVFCLNGNHELMNISGDLRYVTDGGFLDFEGAVEYDPADTVLAKLEPHQRARTAAFRPGGPYALQLSERNVIVVVGENVFVHGGVLPANVDYGIERINAEVSQWLKGERSRPDFINGDDSMVWARDYSDEVDAADCEQLASVLARLGAKRMIVGHTVQDDGITAYCENQVWCIDTGMSAHYGGTTEALEIRGDEIRILGRKPTED